MRFLCRPVFAGHRGILSLAVTTCLRSLTTRTRRQQDSPPQSGTASSSFLPLAEYLTRWRTWFRPTVSTLALWDGAPHTSKLIYKTELALYQRLSLLMVSGTAVGIDLIMAHSVIGGTEPLIFSTLTGSISAIFFTAMALINLQMCSLSPYRIYRLPPQIDPVVSSLTTSPSASSASATSSSTSSSGRDRCGQLSVAEDNSVSSSFSSPSTSSLSCSSESLTDCRYLVLLPHWTGVATRRLLVKYGEARSLPPEESVHSRPWLSLPSATMIQTGNWTLLVSPLQFVKQRYFNEFIGECLPDNDND